LAADIKAEIGVEVNLVRGGGGIFDVTVDGERIYCKQEVGRFPENEEILAQLRR